MRRPLFSAAPDSAAIPADGGPDALHFAGDRCLNCAAALATAYCGDCGQKRAERFGLRAVGAEAWEKLRWFELELLQSGLRLVAGPGRVARAYVLGARKRHVHPLKLLLAAIAVLLFVLAQTRYLQTANTQLSEAMALLQRWSEWSFSIGIVAIVVTSLAVFRGRLGYNATEHLVLAVYVHFLIVCGSVLNLLPLLAAPSPHWIALHRAWSAHYMDAVEVVVLVVAFRQFFLLELRRDGWRLLLAALLFVALKSLLLQLYARLLVKLVLARLAA